MQSTGATVEADGTEIDVRATVVVNATGVWADDVRALDEGAHPRLDPPGQGHPHHRAVGEGRNDIAVVIPVPKDKRSLFVVPWGDLTYIGTTDTDYDGPLDDPQCTPDDIEYVLRALNASVTTGVTEADVTGTWAGLRPLVKSATSGRTADLSRRHAVRRSPSGVVTVTGGKLTTYRRWPPTRSTTVAGPARRRGGAARDQAGCACSAPTATRRRRGRRGAARRPPRRRYGTRAADVRARCIAARPDARPSRSSPACPTCGPRPSTRRATRWRARSTTCCAGAPAPGCSTATRRAAAAADVAALMAPELGLGRRRAAEPGRRLP